MASEFINIQIIALNIEVSGQMAKKMVQVIYLLI
jgi:hypothetical protein